MSVKLRWGAASDIGLVREVNEDSKMHEPPLFAVADGMGGHLAGDVASGMAIDTLSRTGIESAGTLPEAVREANRAIFEKASSDEGLSGMGTTIIAMWADEDSAQIVHVGDCRAYLLRDGELRRLTQDHTVVERLVQEGKIQAEDADRHPQRSYLERALGVDPQVEVDVKAMDTRPGDRFLLCSDGLFGMIDDDRILEILSSQTDPDKAAKRLCKEAVEAGGRDNVTVIVIDYAGDEAKAAGAVVSSAGRAGAPIAQSSGHNREPRHKKSRSRVPALILMTLAVLAAAGALAVFALKNSWYVGLSGDKVAIFQGVNGSVGGVSLSRPDTVSDLEAQEVPNLYRRRLREGISADNKADARSIVENLRLRSQTPPQPTPSPAPTLPPAEPAEPSPAPAPAQALGGASSGGRLL